MKELARLDEIATSAYELERRFEDEDPAGVEAIAAADVAGGQAQQAVDYALAMPIRRKKDIPLKAAIAVNYCVDGTELKAILQEIVAACLPDLAKSLVPRDVIGAS